MSFRVAAWILLGGIALSGCASGGAVLRPSPFPTPASAPNVYPAPLAPSVKSFSTDSFLHAAKALTGVRYRMGGESPATGFDCSGYVRYVFGLFRIPLPRTVSEQFAAGKPAGGKVIRPGDLLFFKIAGSRISHVALAVGPDEFIHAPAESGVVRTEKLSSPYWRARFVGARRIL
ncbi:MAG: C40 family peptidase [Acidobacteria bacterium]|nr:C40 family peptidase [Acidobacteriota bacterium]